MSTKAYSIRYRFIESLTNAKIYQTPPSVEKLSDLFQDFYSQADSYISTHINTLKTRQNRENSPAPSVSSRSSANTGRSAKLKSKASRETLDSLERPAPEQQMLTPQEISDRRKARRVLEHKRLALEEAVERKACESVYNRIWRHRSSLDEVRDEKLRSRVAALALVGISLKDLGVDLNSLNQSKDSIAARVNQVEDGVSRAHRELLKMNDIKYPLGLIHHLSAAHQIIVDLLTNLRQSSSSADDILPTLIYTLITMPSEGIKVISNFEFIQRFRNSNKIRGEAAYCLTNLEAAITFLETVDLATLRDDEALEGPPKPTSQPSTPRIETTNFATRPTPASASISPPATSPVTAAAQVKSTTPTTRPPQTTDAEKLSRPASPTHHRSLSSLFQPPANAFGAASGAVRSTADHSLKNVSNALDSSFKLLFGRLKEQQIQSEGVGSDGTAIVPRTLDDARRLVSPRYDMDENGNISGASSFTEHLDETPERNSAKSGERLLGLIGGQKQARDRSVDSVVSADSGVKPTTLLVDTEKVSSNNTASSQVAAAASSVQPMSASTPTSAVDSMRNLGNTLNPLNRIAGMNMMRGFGRSSPSTGLPSAAVATPAVEQNKEKEPSPKLVAKIDPPVQRFLEAATVNELRMGEIGELLRDYRRLAGALKDLGAF